MKLKTILTSLAVAFAAVAQPALAEFTQDANGIPTHYNGIPIPPMQTVEAARAATEKRLAAIQAEEARQAAQASNQQSEIGNHQLFFTGKPYLEETGQYLFLFRHYDPELSRWTTADPSGFPDGANNVIYAPTPTAGLDPLGMWSAADYAWHYFWGKSPYAKGETVDLSVTGDIHSVKTLSNLDPSGPVAFEAHIESLLIDKLSARYIGSYVDTITDAANIDYESAVFALGDSRLRLNSSFAFTGQQTSSGYSWQYMATFSYSINDEFVDALDLFDWFPGNQDHPFGASFGIVGSWNGSNLQNSGLYE